MKIKDSGDRRTRDASPPDKRIHTREEKVKEKDTEMKKVKVQWGIKLDKSN